MGLLTEVGLDPELVESEPGRSTVVVRVEGDPEGTRDRGALLVHGHLDVVPADAADWQVDPFAGEERDGCLWGRGAVDMKDMDAMMLAVLRDLARTGRKPPRDLVFAFFADEEAGGVLGSHWLVEHRRDLLDGVTEAISEVGGYSVTVDGKDGDPVRLYLLQTAEKGITWLRLVAHGRAGHGSQIATDNAVTRLGAAVARIGAHEWPLEITPTVRAVPGRRHRDHRRRARPGRPVEAARPASAPSPGSSGATLRDTANPTMLKAGYKHNVIPQTAEAFVDCRFLPGHEESLLATVRELAGEHVDVHVHHRDNALETDVRRPPGGPDGRGAAGRGPRRPRAALLPVRWHGQQGAGHHRHPRLRLRAAAAAGRPGLPGHVPRRRRARAARRADLRHPRPRPAAAHLLTAGRGRRQSLSPNDLRRSAATLSAVASPSPLAARMPTRLCEAP